MWRSGRRWHRGAWRARGRGRRRRRSGDVLEGPDLIELGRRLGVEQVEHVEVALDGEALVQLVAVGEVAWEIIGSKTGGAAKFTKRNRISKVAREALDRLVAEGKLRILTPQDVRDIIVAHPKAKIAREANNVMRTMQNNQEILIQGLIPGDLLTPAK